MKRWPELLVLILACVAAASCGNAARYARGMESADIETLTPCDGRIVAVEYPSSETNLDHRRMTVYLPPAYDADTTRRFPVLYLLHGARGNEVTWIERGQAIHSIDSLRREEAIRDFILVLPNINCYYTDGDYNNGHAVNAVRAFWFVNGEAEAHFVRDVVNYVDANFRTIAEKESRAIAGMSTGGMQSLYLSANNPGLFGSIGLFSAYSANTIFGLRHPEFYTGLGRKLRRQFVDAPDYYGIMIGKKDFFYHNMKAYSRRLTRLGYRHEFNDFPGGHKWTNWRLFFVRFCKEVYGR